MYCMFCIYVNVSLCTYACLHVRNDMICMGIVWIRVCADGHAPGPIPRLRRRCACSGLGIVVYLRVESLVIRGLRKASRYDRRV